MSVLCMIYLARCSSCSHTSTASSQVGKWQCPASIQPATAPAQGGQGLWGFGLLYFVLFCFVLFFFPDFFLYSSEYLQQNLSFLFIYYFFFCLFLLKITSKQRKQNTKKCSLSQTLGQHIHLSSLHEALAIKDVIFPLYLNCSVTRLTLSECMHLTFCEHFQYTSKYHIIYQLWESVL